MIRRSVSLVEQQTIWKVTQHAIRQFVNRNKFSYDGNVGKIIATILKMMTKATFLQYSGSHRSEIYSYGKWILVSEGNRIVTIFTKKGSRYENIAV